MSKFTQIFTVILIFGVFFAFPVSAQESGTWTKDVLTNMYMQFLREEGYFPSVDGEGDILFKDSGDTYYIIIRDDDFDLQNDLLFFRLYTGVRLGTFSPEAALSAANFINMYSKVAKIYISSDERSVAINIELLLPNPQDFKTVLSRALSLMRFAEDRFFSRLTEISSSATVSSTP